MTTNYSQTICAVCSAPHPLNDLIGTCKECRETIATFKPFLQSVADAPLQMQLIMRQNNLVMDDITSPQGKLAFTTYTRLCELSMQAIELLKNT